MRSHSDHRKALNGLWLARAWQPGAFQEDHGKWLYGLEKGEDIRPQELPGRRRK
jgi:hypothetical protein